MAFGRQSTLGMGYSKPVEYHSVGDNIRDYLRANKEQQKIDIAEQERLDSKAYRDAIIQQQKDVAQAKLDAEEAARNEAFNRYQAILGNTPDYIVDSKTGEYTEAKNKPIRTRPDGTTYVDVSDEGQVPSFPIPANALEGLDPKAQDRVVGKMRGEAEAKANRLKAYQDQQKKKLGLSPKTEKQVTVYGRDGSELNVPESQVPTYQKQGASLTRPKSEKDIFTESVKEKESRDVVINRIKERLDKGFLFSDELTDDQTEVVEDALSGIVQNLDRRQLDKFMQRSEGQIFKDINDYLMKTEGKRIERYPFGSINPFDDSKGFDIVVDKEAVAKLVKNKGK